MAVRVTREPQHIPLEPEDCVVCGEASRHWWADGVLPLHPTCAEEVGHDWCLHVAEQRGREDMVEGPTEISEFERFLQTYRYMDRVIEDAISVYFDVRVIPELSDDELPTEQIESARLTDLSFFGPEGQTLRLFWTSQDDEGSIERPLQGFEEFIRGYMKADDDRIEEIVFGR